MQEPAQEPVLDIIQTIQISDPPKPYAGYLFFSLRALVPGSRCPCRVSLEALDQEHGGLRLVPALDPGQTVATPWLDALAHKHILVGYLRLEDLDALLDYLGRQIARALAEPAVSRAQVYSLVYEQAMCGIKSAMLEPRNGRRLSQGAGIVREMVQGLWEDDEMRMGLLRMMSTDDQLYSHAVNVCLLGVSLARFQGWPREEAEDLALALFFHDLGMTEVSPEIVCKQGPLDDDERQAVQRHPLDSCGLLRGLSGISGQVLETVQGHHENLDGSGYPRGIRARQLARPARLARIVDSYEAMTSSRSWRPALKPMEALIFMRREMAGQLDLELLAAFIASLACQPA